MIRGDIIYLVPLDNVNPGFASPFQGFSKGILDVEEIVHKILFLPANVVELYTPRRRAISSRMNGWGAYSILPIRKESLQDFQIELGTPFLCIFSQNKTLKQVLQFIKSVQIPILHASTEALQGAISLDELGRNHFYPYIERVVHHLDNVGLGDDLTPLINLMGKPTDWHEERIETNSWKHLATLPNELVLSSLNFRLDQQGPLISHDNGPYVEAIANTAKAVVRLRDRIAEHGFTTPYRPVASMILTVQSCYRHVYRIKLNLKKLEEIRDASSFVKAHRLLKRQKTFSFTALGEELVELFSSAAGSIAFEIRRNETAAYTVAISVKACSNIAPTLRLPPSINDLHPELDRLSGCARGNSPNKLFKMNKIFRGITSQLSEAMDQAYFDLLPDDLSPIKIIADLPLEWLPVKNLPLILRFDASRIPTTPGDLLFYQAIRADYVVLQPEAFENILIIRSFAQNDPMRNVLKSSLKIFDKEMSLSPLLDAFKDNQEFLEGLTHQQGKGRNTRKLNVTIHWADVENEEQFIQSINKYKGPIMIFDGHGAHEKHRDVDSLIIGNNKVELWRLRGKVRIPPIVLLSACDTHPIDGSHASVANGFLAAGATTVLGTVLPIEANQAGLFVARMILRLREFLPVIIKKRDDCVRWTRVISGLQRMSYITELCQLFNEKAFCNLSADAHLRISFQANDLINRGATDWYERILEIIADETGKPVEDIRALVV